MATRQVSLCTHPPNLKVHTEALTAFTHKYHPDDLSTTSLSQDYVLGAAGSEEGKWNAHDKDRGGGEELLMVEVQFTDQLVVTSS